MPGLPRTTLLFAATLFSLVGFPACKRDEPGAGTSDAGPTTTTSPAASLAPSPNEIAAKPPAPHLPEQEDLSIPPTEPTRKQLRKLEDEPLVAAHRDLASTHFGDSLSSPIAVQIEALPADRRAILIPGPPELEKPLVYCVAADGTRAWTKEAPLAGIVGGVREMAIVRGVSSGVALAFCDASQKLGALRAWHADGGIFADYEVVEIPRCEAISALHWPGRGTLVAASGEGEARIGRIDARGMRPWGRSGLTLPWKPEPKSAVSILVDTDDTFVLVGVGTTDESRARHDGTLILAMRYDERGLEKWPAPIEIGRATQGDVRRIAARVVATGKMEVETSVTPPKRAELTSEGSVILLPDRR